MKMARATHWIAQLKNMPKSQIYLPTLNHDNSSSTNRPDLALLVGWAASSHRVLKKYTSIYNTAGVPAICVVPSLFDMWSSKKGDTLTRGLLDGLSVLPSCNIILHLFSSGPTVVLPTLTRQLPHLPSIKLKGIIFDSGPGNFTQETGMNAAKLAFKQAGNSFLPLYVFASVCGTTASLLVGKKKRQELTDALHSPVLHSVPQLYLCSEIDTVSPLKWVDSIVQDQKSRGRDVEMKVWKDSGHVRHYATYPIDYQNRVTDYLKRIHFIK